MDDIEKMRQELIDAGIDVDSLLEKVEALVDKEKEDYEYISK